MFKWSYNKFSPPPKKSTAPTNKFAFYYLDMLPKTGCGTHDETTGCPKTWWPHTAASRHIDLLCWYNLLCQSGLLPLTYSVGCGISIPSRQLVTPLLCVALPLSPALTAWQIPSLTHPVQRRPGMAAWHVLLTSTSLLHGQIISLLCAVVV